MDDWMPGCLDACLFACLVLLWHHLTYEGQGGDLCDLGATFGHPWIPFGHPWGPFSYLVPTLGREPGALEPLVGEGLEKGTQNEGNGDPKWTHFQ